MAFIYTQSDLESRINAGIQGKIGMLISAEDTMNEAVRDVFANTDLRSARRRATLAPNLYNGIFDYTCPTDLKAGSIIDISGQAKRSDGSLAFVTPNEFDIKKPTSAIAIDDYNGTRVLKINSIVDSDSITVAELDSTTSGSSNGTAWTGFGDVTTADIAADTDDYIKGNGSLKWNINATGGTTAGIVNTAINSVDLTNYLGGTSAFFVWAKINSATNLTNYILRFGNDSSNYYSKTVTAQADGTAFAAGWNLLRFEISSLTETGSVTDTALTYFAIYMTKTAGKISESDYKFDWLVLKRGVITNVKYYSKYGWQTSAAAYLENSTTTSDVLVADTDEYNLIIKKGRVLAMREIGFSEGEIQSAERDYEKSRYDYMQRNPSEALILTNTYYEYAN
jgi:hypothetical protein